MVTDRRAQVLAAARRRHTLTAGVTPSDDEVDRLVADVLARWARARYRPTPNPATGWVPPWAG